MEPDGDLSDAVTQVRADVRAELERRNAEHGTLFSLQLSEADALDVASGYVPQSIQAAVLAMLDWRRADARARTAQRGLRFEAAVVGSLGLRR